MKIILHKKITFNTLYVTMKKKKCEKGYVSIQQKKKNFSSNGFWFLRPVYKPKSKNIQAQTCSQRGRQTNNKKWNCPKIRFIYTALRIRFVVFFFFSFFCGLQILHDNLPFLIFEIKKKKKKKRMKSALRIIVYRSV